MQLGIIRSCLSSTQGGRENSCAPKQKDPGEPVGMSVHIDSAFKTPCVHRAEQYNTSVLLGCLISKAAL